jgi:hypothetical protein|tara:strand:+ start:106 stop:315 length:210 start_codon:yes stop_codon:yes gene_type:complete
MNKSYLIEEPLIKIALDKFEESMSMILMFKDKHPEIDYEMELQQPTDNNLNWVIKLDVNGEIKDTTEGT